MSEGVNEVVAAQKIRRAPVAADQRLPDVVDGRLVEQRYMRALAHIPLLRGRRARGGCW